MPTTSQPLPPLDSRHSPEQIFRIGSELASGRVRVACSFSIEDIVLIDLLHPGFAPGALFAIDTGRLHEETYEIAETISRRYGIKIDWYVPKQQEVQALIHEQGLFSFRSSLEHRKECCRIRKIEPLQRALSGATAWVTGQRRGQSVTRAGLHPLEIDTLNNGLLKINPLTFWTGHQLRDYVEKHRLPVNSLYRQGYASIGCAPCTRALKQGETERDGRWWWEAAEHRECGLHRR